MNQFGALTGAVSLGDVGLRYGPQFVRSVAPNPIRQYIFSSSDTQALLEAVQARLDKTKRLIDGDLGADEKVLARWNKKYKSYHIMLENEESVYIASKDSVMMKFRNDCDMKTDIKGQPARLKLLARRIDRFHTKVLSTSQAAHQEKFPDCEEEEELPAESMSSFFLNAASWIWSGFSSSTAESDIESQSGESTNSSQAPSVSLQRPDGISYKVTRTKAPLALEEGSEQSGTPGQGITFSVEFQGIQCTARDARIQTLEQARALISMNGLDAMGDACLKYMQTGSFAEDGA